MNLFGIEIRLARKDNPGNPSKYITQEDCHRAQDGIKEDMHARMDDVKNHINTRIDDLKDYIRNNRK